MAYNSTKTAEQLNDTLSMIKNSWIKLVITGVSSGDTAIVSNGLTTISATAASSGSLHIDGINMFGTWTITIGNKKLDVVIDRIKVYIIAKSDLV